MLEIKEKLFADGYESTVEYADCENLHITEALDGKKVTGYIAYSYEKDRTIIYDYNDGGELLLCDGLVRSVILKSTLKGIESVEFKLSCKDKYLNLYKLKFLHENETVVENINVFMNGCQNCENHPITSK